MGRDVRSFDSNSMRSPAVVAILLAAAFAAPDVAAQAAALTSITQDMREREYREIRGKVLAAATVMPASLYDYRAAPEVRSFGEELNHTADVNFRLCGLATGDDRPAGTGDGAGPPTAKAQIAERLAESFRLCDVALETLTDESAVEPTFGRYIKASHVTAMLGHCWHGYGKLTLMMRLNGIAPAPPG